MRRLTIALMASILLSACNNSAEPKVQVQYDSTSLSPQSNSGMPDTQTTVTDSLKVDSSHLRPDAPTNN